MERLQGKHQNEGVTGRLKMRRRKASYYGGRGGGEQGSGKGRKEAGSRLGGKVGSEDGARMRVGTEAGKGLADPSDFGRNGSWGL